MDVGVRMIWSVTTTCAGMALVAIGMWLANLDASAVVSVLGIVVFLVGAGALLRGMVMAPWARRAPQRPGTGTTQFSSADAARMPMISERNL